MFQTCFRSVTQDGKMPEPSNGQEHSVSPPSLLVWALAGVFVLIIIGSVDGVFVFVNIVRSGQQQRIVNLLPLAAASLPKRDSNALAITTSAGEQSNSLSPEELLNISVQQATKEPVERTATPRPTTILRSPTIAPTVSTAMLTEQPTIQVIVTGVPSEQKPPVDAPASLPAAHYLNGFTWELQNWNNCGPVSISIALSYYGWQQGQEAAAAFLN